MFIEAYPSSVVQFSTFALSATRNLGQNCKSLPVGCNSQTSSHEFPWSDQLPRSDRLHWFRWWEWQRDDWEARQEYRAGLVDFGVRMQCRIIGWRLLTERIKQYECGVTNDFSLFGCFEFSGSEQDLVGRSLELSVYWLLMSFCLYGQSASMPI